MWHARDVRNLTSLEWWILFPLSLLIVGSIAAIAHGIIRRFLGAHTERSVIHAGPLMPTLGALFAFLSAFVIATEWTAQSTSEATVASIASASSQLAWASTAPGVDTIAIQASLMVDLEETATTGWERLQNGDETSLLDSDASRDLQRAVRASAYSPAVSPVASAELLSALDDVSEARRDLVNEAGGTLPTLLFGVLALSGLALTVNSVILVLQNPGRSSVVVLSIVVIVALDLALLLVLAAPFRGTLETSPAPLTAVRTEIASGFFTR